MSELNIGQSIPPDTAHAVSVSLPTWKSNVGYEEGEDWVVRRMVTGYPRFFIHRSIASFAEDIAARYAQEDGQQAMVFPSAHAAARCVDFIQRRASAAEKQLSVRAVTLTLDKSRNLPVPLQDFAVSISAVIFNKALFHLAKQYWQHTGDGTSSRRAEFCHQLFRDNLLILEPSTPTTARPEVKFHKGPKRYRRQSLEGAGTTAATKKPSATKDEESEESLLFVEERYGRNLDLSLANKAASAIKKRIAGAAVADDATASSSLPMGPNSRENINLTEDDIYLFPCGMNAIFNAHRALLEARGSLKSINFGFPYVDTLKTLEKFGPGCLFYGRASSQDLEDLELRLTQGERFLALFCEFPGNPLLTCPDLERIRALADKYDFAVVVDETIGTFANINVLPFADVVVSSLTKIFSGDCNVMGGAAIVNPDSKYHNILKVAMNQCHQESNYWPEDIIFMERNSRDYHSRVDRINENAETICEVLKTSPSVKNIYYPKYNESRSYYERCMRSTGGYGGLLSVTFNHKEQAVAFFDTLNTAKGPSLGTNFTLTSPYVLLAHYNELDWAAGLGVDPNLIRVSVGLEDRETLRSTFHEALDAANCAPTEVAAT